MGDSGERAGPQTVCRVIARFLVARGVERVYGLVGGHIQPLWDELAEARVQIIDVRHESAAVYMAHAEAALTGRLGVALVTSGPGLTNAVSGIANASVARVPVVVISGRTPRPQTGMGAMQDLPQSAIVQPICRRVEAVVERHHVLPRLDAVVRAALGGDGPPGPAYIDFPTDLLRETMSDVEFDRDWMVDWRPRPMPADPRDVSEAAQLLRRARRPLVIAGRGARSCADAVIRFLEATGAVYLDTGESRGTVSSSHPAFVSAMRGRAMAEADLVITLGRRLDFQLAYGSRAVFADDAKFIRIGRYDDEIADNRRGEVEIRADVELALHDLLAAAALPEHLDNRWKETLLASNSERRDKLASQLLDMAAGSDGRMHPYTLIASLNELIDDNTVTVVDGGDILSFARVALKTPPWSLDPGPLGCIGVGVPFANSAALNLPGRRVIALIGDGSFGFMGMELDTAARKRLPVVYVIANNEGWNIDRHDQLRSYRHVVGVDLPGCRYDLVARGLGLQGYRVEDPAQLSDQLWRAVDNAPALVDVLISAEPKSPDFESGLAEVLARQPLKKWHEAEEARLSKALPP